MPELPEVEEVRRTLEPHVLGVVITDVRVCRADFVSPRRAPLGRLTGRQISRTHRHGKKLFLIADDDQTLVLHLGMSGRVDCVSQEVLIARHTHVILSLASGREVRLRDPRRFGGLSYYASFASAQRAEAENLGPDALQLTAKQLGHWKSTKARIKQRLLAQRDVAGLGDIYVDEALWAARIHPQQRLDRLTPGQIQCLVEQILAVLRRSIDSGGTTLRDYRNVSDQPGRFARELKAYGRGGQPCHRCQTVLRSILIAARTTVFCPACQKRR